MTKSQSRMEGRPVGGSQAGDATGVPGWIPDVEDEAPSRSAQPGLNSPTLISRFQAGYNSNSIRAVTPDPESGRVSQDSSAGSDLYSYITDGASITASPRSIPGGEKPQSRRQGVVFRDTLESSTESTPSSTPLQSPRPRTRTLDDPQRPRVSSSTVVKNRGRVGSVNTPAVAYRGLEASAAFSNERSVLGATSRSIPDFSTSPVLSLSSLSHPPPPRSEHIKERRISSRRLIKRSSRPPSPANVAPPPSIDSLRAAIATPDANYTLLLMKKLCGRMRGLVDYQTSAYGSWCTGVCLIDDNMGNLVQESEDSLPFLTVIIPDLRGCQVRPKFSTERQAKCLEIKSYGTESEVRLIPLNAEDIDYWLAALLCWTQLRPGSNGLIKPEVTSSASKRPVNRRESSFRGKEPRIIKVANVSVWDKGIPTSPFDSMCRSSTRDTTGNRSWRTVSCTLQVNGEFKLMTGNDPTPLCVIQLHQLSRRAIQQVDISVLDEQFCIGIYPRYTPSATNLTIIRPLYIALETRVHFEVWFALLRLFAAPDLHGMEHQLDPPLEQTQFEDDEDVSDQEQSIEIAPSTSADMFRVEKSIKLRLIEAKLRTPGSTENMPVHRPPMRLESDPLIGDYLAEVFFDGELRARTMTKTATKNPFWREDCEFDDLPAYLSTIYILLKKLEAPIATYSSSTSIDTSEGASEVVCGIVEIRLDSLDKEKEAEKWFEILDINQEKIGDMLLRIRHDELGVLMTKDYQPLSDMLHTFSAGLTERIALTSPAKLQRCAELFINIFQVSGKATEWLRILIEEEIDGLGKDTPASRLRFGKRVGSNDSSFDSSSDRIRTVRDMSKSLAGEANLLFRGNSLLTQALDFHMRRLGKDYLEEVLQERIMEINEINMDCEVDPSRVSQGEDVARNWTSLIAVTTSVWESIYQSAHKCHPELRQIFKYIQAVADDRFGIFQRTASYTSVTGFLFLRFFCPAILNPKLFGLLRDHPQAKARRTLTLIAKSLQALANLTTFGQKEAWMTPMNRFLSSNRQSLKDFVNELCSIPSDCSTLSLPPSYTTPTQILSKLPPVAKEGLPSLPYLIDYPRNFAALVKLWLENTPSEENNDESIPEDLKAFHQECQNLEKRTEQCLAAMEQRHQPPEAEALGWEDLVPAESSRVSIYSPVMSPNAPTASTQTSQKSHTTTLYGQKQPPGSAGSDSVPSTTSKERRERQSFWEQTFGKDSRYQRPYEPESAVSSPIRGFSRNGGKNKSFLLNLRRKNGKDVSGPSNDSLSKEESGDYPINSPSGAF